jgi:hypothetical protein
MVTAVPASKTCNFEHTRHEAVTSRQVGDLSSTMIPSLSMMQSPSGGFSEAATAPQNGGKKDGANAMPYSLRPVLPAIGRPPKHAARSVGRFIRENRLDRRTAVCRMYESAADKIAEDAGGWPHLNNRETLLTWQAAALWVELHVLQVHRMRQLANGETSHDGNGKYYVALLNAFRRTIETLGLRPDATERRLPTLGEYIAARSNGTPGANDDASPGAPPATGQATVSTDADAGATASQAAPNTATKSDTPRAGDERNAGQE